MVPGIGPHTGRQLVRACGTAERIWKHPDEWRSIDGIGPRLAAALKNSAAGPAEEIIAGCQRQFIAVLCPDDEA